MPTLLTTAYGNCEGVLNLARALVNDARIAGGDVLTDVAPFTFQYLNAAYSDIQFDLANSGYQEFTAEDWLIGIPPVTTVDPATRVIIDDSGTHIVTATGAGSSNSATPVLPFDLLAPLRCWERINGSTDEPSPLAKPKDGLRSASQSGFLQQFEWRTEGLTFLGATQTQDLQLRYVKQLASMALPTDPVPIRGVQNAAAYYVAAYFVAARSPAQAAIWQQMGEAAVQQFKTRTAREQQRTSHRRRPFSFRSRRTRGGPWI